MWFERGNGHRRLTVWFATHLEAGLDCLSQDCFLVALFIFQSFSIAGYGRWHKVFGEGWQLSRFEGGDEEVADLVRERLFGNGAY